MNESVRPIVEAIEAALSAYDSQRHERTLDSARLEFIRIMLSNDRLKTSILSSVDFASRLDLPAELEAELLEIVRSYKVNRLCHMFFWVGWHSRGAIAEAKQPTGL